MNQYYQMSQSVEKLENVTGSNTSTTPIEGFTNPTQNLLPTQSSQENYLYSQGFYYRPYADTTVKTQIIESSEKPSTDLRLEHNYLMNDTYEKVQPLKFYESHAMCTTGCDTNAKFIKMQQ